METKLQVRNLQISFRTISGKLQAVRDISFDLHKGETLAIVGESGSGKSVTSKAILGILAGNSIVEGGEILYDGQDLLKITEDDFYKIRGDKIAMIFQDPLSSLNPIMRIGKQLTEAMLLKGKANQRASKAAFHGKLGQLEKDMLAVGVSSEETVKARCHLFRQFELRAIRLEQDYGEAYHSAQDALNEIENILFLIEKNALEDAAGRLAEVKEFSLRAHNPYVVADDRFGELKTLADTLSSRIAAQTRAKNYAPAVEKLRAIQTILREASAKPKPDFFALGYYMESNGAGAPEGDMARQNAYYAHYLEDHFLREFVDMAERAVTAIDAKYLTLRQSTIEALDRALVFMNADPLDATALRTMLSSLSSVVDQSINPIDIVKDSAACTFSSNVKDFVDTYFRGLRTNGGKLRKYERQMRRYNRLVARGKNPDWKVAAASTIDLELVQENIIGLMTRLKAHYEQRNAAEVTEDKREKAERLIAFLRESASGIVNKVTKRGARNKALKLMEEVGIPEPRKRYMAYPFQFSGGMRQRIVIAIALAANPDILICDEPTTALDVTIQSQILELINRLKEERNLSIIFITHDLGVVANMADRIAVMYAGKIVEYGTADEIFYHPAHPYTWALLSSMPDLETKDRLEAIPGTPPNMIYPPKGDAFADRNRYAMQVDFEYQPPIFPITDTHWAATWLLDPKAPKVDPPKAVTDRIANMIARMGGEANG